MQLSIRARLLLVVGVMAGGMLTIGLLGVGALQQTDKSLETVFNDRLVPEGDLALISNALRDANQHLTLAIGLHDPESPAGNLHNGDHGIDRHFAAIDEEIRSAEEAWKRYSSTYMTPDEKKLADEFDAELKTYLADGFRPAYASVKAGDFRQANLTLARKVLPEFKKVEDGADALLGLQITVGRQEHDESQARYQRSLAFVTGVLIAALALALVMAFTAIRYILQSLARASEVAHAMADRDLRNRMENAGSDEIGRMASSLNAAMDAVNTSLSEVRMAAQTVAVSSDQLSSASTSISAGAQEQASSLEETAASLEEITGTVKQNADNAQQAAQLAQSAREVAEKGGHVVSEAVHAMSEINASSKKIAEIITAIDEIAFQTNLLALNAAVEAARAGEQGRGFAVVAGEVRNLAQRSASAAKEIKGLIQDSVRKVESGSELVNRSGRTLEEIVASVKRVTDIVAEIAAASREQSSGIDQVGKAVSQMDQVTQSNAAQTEELASTAEALSTQAQQLQAMVARFQLSEGHGAPVARAASASRPATKHRPSLQLIKKPHVVAHAAPAPASEPVAATGTDDGFSEF